MGKTNEQGNGFRRAKIPVLAQACGVLLGLASTLLFLALLGVRIDTPADREQIWVLDAMLGLMLGCAVALMVARVVRPSFTIAAAIFACVLSFGLLILWHERQLQIRWTTPKHVLALNQLTIVRNAMHDHARDCGSFPPPANGLVGLVVDRGEIGWAGPYLEESVLIDPWGRSIRYYASVDWAEIWSVGPDGRDGTKDDIRVRLKPSPNSGDRANVQAPE